MSELPWQIITVNYGREQEVPRLLGPQLKALGVHAEFSIPTILRPSKKEPLLEVPALPGYLLVALDPERASLRLKGMCDLVTGFLPRIGSEFPAVVSREVFAEFLSQVALYNEVERRKILAAQSKTRLKEQVKQVKSAAGTLALGSQVTLAGGLEGMVLSNRQGATILATQILGRLVNVTVSARRQGRSAQEAA